MVCGRVARAHLMSATPLWGLRGQTVNPNNPNKGRPWRDRTASQLIRVVRCAYQDFDANLYFPHTHGKSPSAVLDKRAPFQPGSHETRNTEEEPSSTTQLSSPQISNRKHQTANISWPANPAAHFLPLCFRSFFALFSHPYFLPALFRIPAERESRVSLGVCASADCCPRARASYRWVGPVGL